MGDYNEQSKLRLLSFDQGLRLVFITRLLFQATLLIFSVIFILAGLYICLMSSKYNELMLISMILYFLTVLGVVVSLDLRCVYYHRSLERCFDDGPMQWVRPSFNSVRFMDRFTIFLFLLACACFLIGVDLQILSKLG